MHSEVHAKILLLHVFQDSSKLKSECVHEGKMSVSLLCTETLFPGEEEQGRCIQGIVESGLCCICRAAECFPPYKVTVSS